MHAWTRQEVWVVRPWRQDKQRSRQPTTAPGTRDAAHRRSPDEGDARSVRLDLVREVSCKAIQMVLDVLEASRIPVEPLVAGLPVSLAELRDTSGRVDWEVYAELLERIERTCGDDLPFEEIGARILRVPQFELLRRAGRLLMGPRHLYGIAGRLFPPLLFPDVVVRQVWLPTGRLVVTGQLPPHYRESIPFFRLCHGNVSALPRLLDLPASKIEEQALSGRSGRLVLLPPPSHTLVARFRRSARAVGALSEVWRGIERHQKELDDSLAALRTSRHELQQLIERLPDGVLIQREGTVRWANAALLEIFGLQKVEDVVGRSIPSFVPPEDREPLALAMRRAALSQVNDTRPEYRIQRPDGSLRRVQAGTAQLVDFGGEPARMVVVRDVTEQHRLREQGAISDRLASLGALAASIAHEINNPLAYVVLNLEVASSEAEAIGSDRPDLRESLAHASEGTLRVLEIVRNMKMLSRLDETSHAAVDLAEVLDASIAVAERVIRAKAHVVRSYEPTPPARVMRGKLGQVFLNLLTNAAEAIPEGTPSDHRIRVSTHTGADGRAVVEIADTGSGIPPQIASRIFDPFFTTKPVGHGTGLGLAMCHRIVSELGGEIAFESAPGATTFRVTLPVAAPHDTVVQGVHEERQAPISRPRRRVLVIDDEPSLLQAVGKWLADTHDVVTAPSGRAALDILGGDRRFDAVLADLMMADVTGMDLYERVREHHPGLERRFVFMTGGAFTPRAQRFVAETPNRCLEKPFAHGQLLDAVDLAAEA
jgi:PAS domain S-box-containing protein